MQGLTIHGGNNVIARLSIRRNQIHIGISIRRFLQDIESLRESGTHRQGSPLVDSIARLSLCYQAHLIGTRRQVDLIVQVFLMPYHLRLYFISIFIFRTCGRAQQQPRISNILLTLDCWCNIEGLAHISHMGIAIGNPGYVMSPTSLPLRELSSLKQDDRESVIANANA